MHQRRIFLFAAAVWAGALGLTAQTADTLSHTLRDVQVKGHKLNTYLGTIKGKTVVSLEMMEQMPRILGNADPMHYAQLLPGVQTNSEYDAGLHIQGCDNQHNMVSIEGVPLYNVAHMLGFFSIFNATHFETMQFAKSAFTAETPNRIGGQVDMTDHTTRPPRTTGSISVGPMSSQGTIRIPTDSRSSLTLSAREAYLNLLYSQWLTIEDQSIRYGFGDYNLTYRYEPDSTNTLWIDAYAGHDNVGYDDNSYSLDTRLKWSNTMAALHWNHRTANGLLSQTAYYTGYRNRLSLDMEFAGLNVPSSIWDMGYKMRYETERWNGGIDVAYHTIQPQNPLTRGIIARTNRPQEKQRALEASFYAGYSLPVGSQLLATAGLRANYYRQGESNFFSADPTLALSFSLSKEQTLTLQTALKHQYLIKSGFSNAGLPTEFWFSAGQQFSPQYAWSASLTFDTYLFNKMLRLSAETYFKRLFHQVEYEGNVFDFFYSDYRLDNVLLRGNGTNYGLNVMLEKRKGRITGWLSYSLGRAMRQFPGTKLEGWFPANHERIHELNAVASCRLSPRWSVGATYVFASGTPYTIANHFYLINSYLISEYGKHNDSRTDHYGRLDLSVNYDFKTRKRWKSGINLSLYNVLMNHNNLYYRLKIYKEEFGNRPFNFVLKIMPSINYYARF